MAWISPAVAMNTRDIRGLSYAKFALEGKGGGHRKADEVREVACILWDKSVINEEIGKFCGRHVWHPPETNGSCYLKESQL